ncbi:MAG: archaeal heat shock protein Hsp20, partial [Nitrosopumilaceae archaeon]|nr:archaeal heat shock protein Hsp20 [Nitrosopumilaceae archaeon]
QVQTYGPYYYGYELTVGPDGKPHLREWGNARPTTAPNLESGARQVYVDEILDKDNNQLKLVAEMPGVEKSDINVTVEKETVNITAKNNERSYQAIVPLKQKIKEDSAKARYANGILEVTFSLAEEKPKGKSVIVE